MSTATTGNLTQVQGEEERHLSRNLSLQRQQPPTAVPGYVPEKFLGAGAYGEVWVARDRNTGRKVAIKFYAHRGGLDWSLLSREVDKLALLFSDRHIIQLIEVGWDADPPYYVMEFLERGSLEERLKGGPLPTAEAVALAREVTVGLVHAHNKGVLHCDLKPANVLLDQDSKPRLADFGQSRLSHEQTPALGTLFYMAPEQADLAAAPDARWDVYALGALLFCMLTGEPPYRNPRTAAELNRPGTLEERLERYRRLIAGSRPPDEHKHVPGVDTALAEIIDRCLAVDPRRRYPNAEAVLEAIDERALRRGRRPLIILGGLGPALLLGTVALMAWTGFHTAVNDSTASLERSSQVSDEFAAQVFADHVAGRIDRRWRILEQEAADAGFRDLVRNAVGKPLDSPERRALQVEIEDIRAVHPEIPSAAWVLFDRDGNMIARAPFEARTIDLNFAFRDFFHGRGKNLAPGTRTEPIKQPHRSVVYHSQSTNRPRTVAFSVPVLDGRPSQSDRKVLGVLATTIEVGNFADFRPRSDLGIDLVPVLVDTREDEHGHRGTILIHPSLARRLRRDPDATLPNIHVDPATIKPWSTDYRDPMAAAEPEFAGRWFAASHPVIVEGRDPKARQTGWVVIVQERYAAVIGPVETLRSKLVFRGVVSLIVIIIMLTVLWGIVIGVINVPHRSRIAAILRRRAGGSTESTSGASLAPSDVVPVNGEPVGVGQAASTQVGSRQVGSRQ